MAEGTELRIRARGQRATTVEARNDILRHFMSWRLNSRARCLADNLQFYLTCLSRSRTTDGYIRSYSRTDYPLGEH
eukprot:5849313-Pyramimonas_sp.AAC.1